jgi:hypothetical protein
MGNLSSRNYPTTNIVDFKSIPRFHHANVVHLATIIGGVSDRVLAILMEAAKKGGLISACETMAVMDEVERREKMDE